MAVAQDYPYSNAFYRVDIPAIPQAQAFDEVILPELIVEIEEVREGNDPAHSSRKVPGLTKYTNLILKRGFFGTLDLYQWWKMASNCNHDARQNMTVLLLNEDRNAVASWKVIGAFPVRYTFSALNSLDGSPLIESLEVCCDTVEME